MTYPAVAFSEIRDAFDYVGFGGYGESEVWLCRETGKFHWHSDYDDDLEPLPDDVGDADKYISIPHKHDLDLGKALVMQFAAEHMDDSYDTVRDIFNRRGAYARFKDLLDRHDKLQQWHEYEDHAVNTALRQWCAENDIVVEG